MLKAIGISKKYKEKTVLSELDIELKKGDFVVVMGPSGSGKSTLFNILSTLDKPDAGSLFIDGTDITRCV